MRRANSSDAGRLYRTQVASVKGGCLRHYTREQIHAWIEHLSPSQFKAAIRSGREIYVVGLLLPHGAMRILGFGYAWKDEIQAVYVHPKYSGQGIAGRLLKFLERRIAAHGIREIRLNASFAAECFYVRMGYEPLGTLWMRTASGVPLPARQMRKSIALV